MAGRHNHATRAASQLLADLITRQRPSRGLTIDEAARPGRAGGVAI